MCWLYNSTKREIFYSLDTESLNKINEKFGGQIFTCINPSGSLKGISHQPIIFQYHPRQFQEYLVNIQLIYIFFLILLLNYYFFNSKSH